MFAKWKKKRTDIVHVSVQVCECVYGWTCDHIAQKLKTIHNYSEVPTSPEQNTEKETRPKNGISFINV